MPYARSHFRRSVKPLYEIYKKIGRVYCPALKTHVFFDKQGFSHFFYKGKSRNYKLRNHTVAWERVNCLPEVIRILREKPVVRRTIRKDGTIFYIFLGYDSEVVVVEKEVEGLMRLPFFLSVFPLKSRRT